MSDELLAKRLQQVILGVWRRERAEPVTLDEFFKEAGEAAAEEATRWFNPHSS